jgi:DNA invertase Pin-like site-specific DNA recombinase
MPSRQVVAGDVLVVRWFDRLGRNHDDVRNTVQALMRNGVIVRNVINNFTFDGYAARRTMPNALVFPSFLANRHVIGSG